MQHDGDLGDLPGIVDYDVQTARTSAGFMDELRAERLVQEVTGDADKGSIGELFGQEVSEVLGVRLLLGEVDAPSRVYAIAMALPMPESYVCSPQSGRTSKSVWRMGIQIRGT